MSTAEKEMASRVGCILKALRRFSGISEEEAAKIQRLLSKKHEHLDRKSDPAHATEGEITPSFIFILTR